MSIPTAPQGLDLIINWTRQSGHDQGRTCPACKATLSSVAVVELAYTFQTCTCGSPEYAHLIEQLWHLTCLRSSYAG